MKSANYNAQTINSKIYFYLFRKSLLTGIRDIKSLYVHRNNSP